jgi:peroxiredoxin family protein
MSSIAAAIVAKTSVTLGELEIIFLTGEGIQILQKTLAARLFSGSVG